MEIKKTIADAIKALFKKTKGIYVWRAVIKDWVFYIIWADAVLRFKTDIKENWEIKDFQRMMGRFYTTWDLNYELEEIKEHDWDLGTRERWMGWKEKCKITMVAPDVLKEMAKRLPTKSNLNPLLDCIHFTEDGTIEASDGYYLECEAVAFKHTWKSDTCIEAKYLWLWEVRRIKETLFEESRIQTVYYDDFSITINDYWMNRKSFPDTQKVFDMYSNQKVEREFDFYSFLKEKKLIKASNIEKITENKKVKIVLNYDFWGNYNEVIKEYYIEEGRERNHSIKAGTMKKFKGTFQVRETTLYQKDWSHRTIIMF